MRDYEELVKSLRENAEWADGNIWEVPIMLPDNLRQAADAIEELCKTKCCVLDLALDGNTNDVEWLRAFLKAKDNGRSLILDDRTALAIAAGARSIRGNKRLAGTTYVYDVFGKDGGPYEINYNEASEILTTIWDAYPLPEPPKEEI